MVVTPWNTRYFPTHPSPVVWLPPLRLGRGEHWRAYRNRGARATRPYRQLDHILSSENTPPATPPRGEELGPRPVPRSPALLAPVGNSDSVGQRLASAAAHGMGPPGVSLWGLVHPHRWAAHRHGGSEVSPRRQAEHLPLPASLPSPVSSLWSRPCSRAVVGSGFEFR